ncbi:MAG: N-acetylmuramic acid 6-phosphate etherase [Phaeovulum sp.]|uniref:N-acetylmuramic acid 6-phosphate etherase n=1 Tax=Phaeovulum sp. TaxID=2934796 RepID=UPI00272F79F7|nr:N-acetylmuramic acid 6-phosphate etherase [Phaeovulum sp.]MDP2062926.1 N-acetylmuramic acid 6-phosphate etherase [Phaeovulum sp.]MDP3862273.1 N-acetylmuramic acid 6-phosphate etherase [Phaeovulum sp.]
MNTTETASPRFADIDHWPTADLTAGIIEAQYAAIAAVQAAQGAIARAVDLAAARLERGAGRLIYIGAGTSGRIGTQDCVELRPTFNWPDARTLVVMAGGPQAFLRAREGAEDSAADAEQAFAAAAVGQSDVVLGVAASGRTAFTIAGLRHARAAGALTIGLFNNPGAPLGDACEVPVLLATGSEFLAGSTRMKAGTAQKVALNAFSTALMIRLGFVCKGLMVEMKPTNAKLRDRAAGMVSSLSGASTAASAKALEEAGGSVKLAALMLARKLARAEAEAALARAGGRLDAALAVRP